MVGIQRLAFGEAGTTKIAGVHYLLVMLSNKWALAMHAECWRCELFFLSLLKMPDLKISLLLTLWSSPVIGSGLAQEALPTRNGDQLIIIVRLLFLDWGGLSQVGHPQNSKEFKWWWLTWSGHLWPKKQTSTYKSNWIMQTTSLLPWVLHNHPMAIKNQCKSTFLLDIQIFHESYTIIS